MNSIAPPLDTNIELTVLQAILQGSIHRDSILSQVTELDFFNATHKEIFTKLKTASIEGQIESVAHGIMQAQAVARPDRKVKLWNAVECLLDLSSKRKIMDAHNRIGEMLGDPATPANELNKSIESILTDAIDLRTGALPDTFSNGIDKFRDSLKDCKIAWRTGFPELDSMMKITANSFVLVAARPGVGKTALTMSMLLSGYYSGRYGAFASMEMGREELIRRMVSMMTGVPFHKLLDGWRGMNEGVKETVDKCLKELKTWENNMHERWLWSSKRLSVLQLKNWIKHVRPQYVMIDYVQLIKSSERLDGRTSELEEIIFSLRDVAQELSVPIIALAQLNRGAAGSEPVIENLKGSSAFEQAGTEIILMDRPEGDLRSDHAKRNYKYDDGRDVVLWRDDGVKTNRAVLKVVKNRNGPTGYTVATFDPVRMMFSEEPKR